MAEVEKLMEKKEIPRKREKKVKGQKQQYRKVMGKNTSTKRKKLPRTSQGYWPKGKPDWELRQQRSIEQYPQNRG